MQVKTLIAVALACAMGATVARAETVHVKYRGPVDLAPFACEWTPRSSFVERVCYDRRERYMLISLQGTYYQYCAMPATTASGLLSAPSIGRFYNAQVRGRYDCRANPLSR